MDIDEFKIAFDGIELVFVGNKHVLIALFIE